MSPPLLVTSVVFISRRELRGPYLFTAQTRNSNSVVRNLFDQPTNENIGIGKNLSQQEDGLHLGVWEKVQLQL